MTEGEMIVDSPLLSVMLLGSAGVSGFAKPSQAAILPMAYSRQAWSSPWNFRSATSRRCAPREIVTALMLSIPRGGQVSDDDLAQAAFDWTSQLGAPAALVAGAVLATLSETRESLVPHKNDKVWIRVAKKLCRALLLSSFAFEVFCIFVTTVTGTMLLSHGDVPAGQHAGIHYHSPMGFLNHNHEFEYLTSRVTFLQGLLHWLLAVALDVFIPKAGEGLAARKMNLFISSSLIGMVIMILKFYNDHMTFYSNYGAMMWRYVQVTVIRYFWNWPMRPLSLVAVPWIFMCIKMGWDAFISPPDNVDDKDN